MRDEDDGEELRVVALQALLLPLREPSAPWGEVLARARVATVSVPPRRIRYAAIAAAIAASLVLGWAWARRGTEPTPMPTQDHATSVNVAAPSPAFEPAAPPRLPVADMPAPDPAPSLVPAKPAREDAKSSVRGATRGRHHRSATGSRTSERRPRDSDDSRPTTTAAVPEQLPDTLSTTDIRNALMPIAELARACGKTHGGTPGDRVIIKFTVDGATGLVSSSNARPPFEDTALGRCVAEAVAQAVFPRFRKPKLGVMYPFEL